MKKNISFIPIHSFRNKIYLGLLAKTFFICLVTSSLNIHCENSTTPEEDRQKAEAGEDQETYVGSYAVINVSQSQIKEPISLIEWEQNCSNPKEVNLFSQSSLKDYWILAFETEGIYKFYLHINCESGNVFTDSVIVTVNPRQETMIDDIYLEARIRYRLDYKEGELNVDKLQLIDSLPSPGFHIKNYKTISLNGLEHCTNLVYLALANESITNLGPLSNLIKLEFLNLNQNYTIEDISPIYNLLNLKTLIIYSNPIKDISGLGNLTNLTYLDILGTPISDISSLASLVNLETLYFDGAGTETSFNSIEPLSNLTKLRYLDIADRGITDIRPLKNLTELILLSVSYNNLAEISAVSNMKKLIRLYIRKNNVEDITGIRNLENLDYLDAADNQIKDISELQYLSNIHLIGLSGNKIEDILPLVNNSYLGEGVYLYLGGNPLNEKSLNEYVPELTQRGVTVYTNL